jgi:AcrR family transcriptional regulator
MRRESTSKGARSLAASVPKGARTPAAGVPKRARPPAAGVPLESSARRPRVRRAPEESRNLILEAAIRVLSQKGPEAVGLKEVAAEAGVSHALVVHYFGTYDALVDATVLECAVRLRRRMIDHIRETRDLSPESLMQVYFDAVLEPWYGRLVSWALLSDHEGTKSHAARLAPEIKLIADATYNLLKERGPGFTRAQSETFMVALWSLAIGYVAGKGFFWRALGRTPGPRHDRDLRAALAELVRALFG